MCQCVLCVPSDGVEPSVSSISARCSYRASCDGLAEREGFEPTPAHHRSALAGRRHQPLGHLSKASAGTRKRIRTSNLGVLGAAPLPLGPPGHMWNDGVSNPGRAVCKAALCTCTHPVLPRTPGRIRTGNRRSLEPLPSSNWATRAYALGAEDSNLYKLLQRQPCCRLHKLPMSVATSGYRESNPDLLHGEQLHCRCATATKLRTH